MIGSETAKSLRRRGGHAEDCLWQIVRAGRLDGWKFRRQHPIGRYVVDFACPELRLVIEVDGDIHALPDVAARDEERTVELSALGWTGLRFPNDVAIVRPSEIAEAVRRHAVELKRAAPGGDLA